MKILVIGGTKFIGKEIVRQTLEAGHQVTLFNRGKSIDSDLPVIIGDVENILDYKDELLKVKPDVLVHCISNSEKNADDIVEIFKNTGTKVIALSSMDCYDGFQQFVRGKETMDFPLNEESLVTPIHYYWEEIHPHGNNYDKNLMTNVFIRAFRDGNIKPVIFRLPMVYGPNDYQFAFRHGSIIRRINDKEKDYIISSNEYNKIWTFGYVENIAAAIVYAYDKPETNGKVYNLGESKVRSWHRWCELYSAESGFDFNFHVLPDEVVNKKTELLNKIPGNIIVDNQLYSRDTGFIEPVSLKMAIKRTLEYGLAHPDILGQKPDYISEKILKEKYLKFLESANK